MKNTLETDFFKLAKYDKHKAIQLAFNAYWNLLYQHALRKVQCSSMAQDLVQDFYRNRTEAYY